MEVVRTPTPEPWSDAAHTVWLQALLCCGLSLESAIGVGALSLVGWGQCVALTAYTPSLSLDRPLSLQKVGGGRAGRAAQRRANFSVHPPLTPIGRRNKGGGKRPDP